MDNKLKREELSEEATENAAGGLVINRNDDVRDKECAICHKKIGNAYYLCTAYGVVHTRCDEKANK